MLSTVGNADVTGVAAKDEDFLAFTPNQLGANTAGTWALYFDGSDEQLNTSSDEDIVRVSVNSSTGDVHLNTLRSYAVNNLAGGSSDIFTCAPQSLGQIQVALFRSTGLEHLTIFRVRISMRLLSILAQSPLVHSLMLQTMLIQKMTTLKKWMRQGSRIPKRVRETRTNTPAHKIT